MSNFLTAWTSVMFGGGATAEESPDSAATASKALTGGTVLLIDDDVEFLQLTANLLRNAGYAVMTSNTGAKGLNMIRYAQEDLRLILLDYSMPRLNGGETLAFLRKLSPQVPVIGVTGLAPNEVPQEYRDNLDALIFKPLRGADLLASLAAVLKQPRGSAPTASPA